MKRILTIFVILCSKKVGKFFNSFEKFFNYENFQTKLFKIFFLLQKFQPQLGKFSCRRKFVEPVNMPSPSMIYLLMVGQVCKVNFSPRKTDRDCMKCIPRARLPFQEQSKYSSRVFPSPKGYHVLAGARSSYKIKFNR